MILNIKSRVNSFAAFMKFTFLLNLLIWEGLKLHMGLERPALSSTSELALVHK